MKKEEMMHQTMREEEQMFLLCQADGIGCRSLQKLIARFGSADAVLGAPSGQWEEVLTKRQCEALAGLCKRGEAARRYLAFRQTGLRFVPFTSPDYPSRLKEIPDPPKALYVKGALPKEEVPAVAVIGARMCSEYGRYMARQFGAELAAAGLNVVSGMAFGVDSIAQRAALRAGGRSYAVLGCGADVCYPPENADLYEELCTAGGILSEYLPGTQPQRQLFPPRNRIISGLADAVLVVEARRKSGTLITVDLALEQGKEVYALPGRATDRLSDGCNELIRQGAMIATAAGDIIESFFDLKTTKHDRKESTDDTEECHGTRGAADGPRFSLQEQEREILDALDVIPKCVSDVEAQLAARGRIYTPQDLTCRLVEMALKGLIVQEGSFFSLRMNGRKMNGFCEGSVLC